MPPEGLSGWGLRSDHLQTVLPPPEIGLHERRCPFSLLQCQWHGCPFVGTYYDHARHTEICHNGPRGESRTQKII